MIANVQVDRFADYFGHGSKTLRADFHLHTKADKEFSYKGDERAFCHDYVQRLADEGISVGVITNHKTSDIPYDTPPLTLVATVVT